MIGERLYDLRKDAGLTQTELGNILSVNKHAISSYERDKSEPPDELKILIARYFNVSIDYLLGLTDSPAPRPVKNMIVLPDNIPDDGKSEIREFVRYIKFKYNLK
ncbi:helix-turn-helix transcriptional regulator (plasmid) [Enterocloster clostridioformis]